jgi:2-oxoglutarate dehydrogenase E2 component (dihydrolipoamide succinyltransferase)
LVKELDLDPSQIPGSGRDGRIHKGDVVAYLDGREQTEPQLDPDAVPAVAAPPRLSGEAGRPEQRHARRARNPAAELPASRRN